MKLLSTSYKTALTEDVDPNVIYAMLYLEPSLDYRNICPASTKGCRSSCLTNSGMMRMPVQTNARIERTKFYLDNPKGFKALLVGEIHALKRKADRQGKVLSIRLNGTSDIDWSDVYEQFPDVQFNEYSKVYKRIPKLVSLHNNLHITASKQERMSDQSLWDMVAKGINTAVVFNIGKNDSLPSTFKGVPVIDGDAHDIRWKEESGKVIGLRLKGTKVVKQSAIDSGFAVEA